MHSMCGSYATPCTSHRDGFQASECDIRQVKSVPQVVTYDVMNRTEVWFTGKDLKLGCEASSALWLAVPPVKINGGLYADGGVTEIVPQAKLDNRKDVVTIFVDLKPREGSKPRTKPPGNAIELMSDLHDAASHQLTQLEIANLEARLGPNLVIAQPAGDPFESALDFDKGKMKQVYDDGYSTAKAMVEDIRRKL